MSARHLIAAALTLGCAAWAQSAQDELERQLKEMVGKPPTKLLLEYEGLDQPNYKLVEVTFDLDGSSLPVPSLDKLNGEGKHLIFHGDIKPGKHTLETTVVLTDVAGALFSYEAGYKWKVRNTRSFEQQPGLEVQVVITPDLSPGEKDPKKKFALKSTATPKMLAKLEDGTMPEVPKPNLGKAEEVPDAGTVVAAAEPSAAEKAKILKAQQAEEARAKKQAAIEEAKRKKEEAAAAKAAAAEEKKRKREEALAAAKSAKEEKARQKAEALAAAKAAADEKKRHKEEALAAAKSPKPLVEPTPAPEPAPAERTPPPQPEPVAEVDAGAPVVAKAEAPKAPEPQKPAEVPAETGGGLPLPIILGVGVALLGLILFIVMRKRSQQPPY